MRLYVVAPLNSSGNSEVVESPSLEIFKTCLDKVLCSLLWVTLLRQGVGLGDPQRFLPASTILCVLGLARTGLIFTGLQEGAQPGGLTPPGQTEPGIPYHVPPCWVPVGGSRLAGTLSRLGRARRCGPAGRLSGMCGLCCVFSLSVSLLLLFPLFVVLLNCPYPTHQFLPVSSGSPPHPSGGRVGRVALLLAAAAKPEHCDSVIL